MEKLRIISGASAAEVWGKMANDFVNADIFDYNVLLQQPGQAEVLLEIEIDPGGGFEGGYEWTRFSAPVSVENDFRFALHHETFLDKAGKLVGLEDKIIGYKEFDEEFIVKTNDEEKIAQVFSDADVRSFFQSLQDFNLHIAHHNDTATKLELEIEKGIVDINLLREIYDAFSKVLLKLQQVKTEQISFSEENQEV